MPIDYAILEIHNEVLIYPEWIVNIKSPLFNYYLLLVLIYPEWIVNHQQQVQR